VSRAVHSRYERHLADLPSLRRSVSVHLWVRRFYCRNADCARQTFVERLPKLAMPFARRTCRLAAAQGQTGLALGGEASARLLSGLSMPVSADTVLRLVKAMPLPDQPAPRVIGVDDWAKRKGCSYGTIIVDLERHRVVDLRPERSAATLTDWLRQQPGIEVVARCGSGGGPMASVGQHAPGGRALVCRRTCSLATTVRCSERPRRSASAAHRAVSTQRLGQAGWFG
jgi:transposase